MHKVHKQIRFSEKNKSFTIYVFCLYVVTQPTIVPAQNTR